MAKTRASRRKQDPKEEPATQQTQQENNQSQQAPAMEAPAEQTTEPEKKPAGKKKLFSAEAIDESVERSEKFSEYLPDAPPGGYPDAIFVGSELQMSKSKQPMIVITIDVADKYAEVKEFNVFMDNNEKVSQVSQNKVVDFMLQAFGYKILPVDGDDMVEILNGIIDQMNKFEGKKLAVAIKGEMDVYTATKENGETEMKETIRARLWYVRKHGTDLNFNAAKSIKPLSDKEKENIAKRNASKATAEPVKRDLTAEEKAEIDGNPLLNEEEKQRLISKGVTEQGDNSGIPAWARS